MEKKIDFRVDYSNIKVFDEFNVKELEFPMVISVPHSGKVIPEEFLKNVNKSLKELRSNDDSFVDELLKGAVDAGIPTIKMNVNRVFVDVNRDKIEIDPNMYFDYPSQDNCSESRRCRVGLGVIHRIDAQNKNIYNALISFEEAQERIKNVYDVYHKRLQQIIDKTIKKFGFCFLLDCHSMPSKICSMMQDTDIIEFCLGNLFEQSCPPEIYEHLKKDLDAKGYNVLYNCPYSGAFITFNYCQPRKKVYTLQLEVNRGLYMDEELLEKNAGFQHISSDISSSVHNLAKFLLDFKG